MRQGCVIPPMLFLIVMDWVIRKATADPHGISWGVFGKLEDLDFADDFALLSHSQKDMQAKTNAVGKFAEAMGLKIHSGKTKVMKVNARNNQPIKIGTDTVDEVDKFCYLGSNISPDKCTEQEVNIRIGKAVSAFSSLNNI